MRKRFEVQLELGVRPIEQMRFPKRSRDELPKVLRSLQQLYIDPGLNKQVFDILEHRLDPTGKRFRNGRPGMSLWEILVLGIVRLTLDVNYDRLEHIANNDRLVRDLLGISTFGDNLKEYRYQTLHDNISLLSDEMLEEINAVVVSYGHRLFKKKKKKVCGSKWTAM